MRFDLVINRMTYEAWKNKRIYLMKDGTQRRPTLHIKDAINAMKYMLSQKSNKINKHIFNVGCDGNNLEMVQIANMVNAQFKNKFKIKWYGSKDFRSYFVSFSKIKNLGFKGKYKPSDGMKEIIKKLESKKIDLNEKTITLDWYEKIENWKRIIDNISINDKLLKK